MSISPQLRLSFGLIALLLSTVFIADFIGLLPRAEEQIRESRKILGESLAIQLSTAAATSQNQVISNTIQEIVLRNDDIVHASLWHKNGHQIAAFGDSKSTSNNIFDFSTFDSLVVPIFQGNNSWGEVKLQFAPSKDWGMRYLGFPSNTLSYIIFLAIACLITFYLFMRKALSELNPGKVVPKRVNAAFDVLAEGVFIIDEQERIVLANKSFAARIGEEPEYLTGKNPSIFDWDLSGDQMEELPWHTVLQRDVDIVSMPLKIQVDNEQINFTVNASAIRDEYGEIKGVLTTFDDVTPLEQKNDELAKMLAELSSTKEVIEEKNRELEILATRDSLTGCLNRRSFFQIYKEHFLQAQREGIPLSVLMVDIDHFKKVNDNHGHPVGDKVIKLVAGVLQAMSQPSDIVGRYGGEEFAFSLPGVGLEDGLQLAERVKEKVATLPYSEDLPFDTLTVSVGVACFSLGLDDHTELLDQADRGLYKAKQTGRNRVCAYDPDYESTPHQTMIDQSIQNIEAADSKEANKLRQKLQNMDNIIRKQADELTRRSMHDELTGLPNRYLLVDRLTHAIPQYTLFTTRSLLISKGDSNASVILFTIFGTESTLSKSTNSIASSLCDSREKVRDCALSETPIESTARIISSSRPTDCFNISSDAECPQILLICSNLDKLMDTIAVMLLLRLLSFIACVNRSNSR